jgi:hypothetical protein
MADAPHPQKRMAKPSKGRRTSTTRPHKDNAMTSGRRDRSPPSPSVLCDHPRRPQHHLGHCITIPNTVRGRGDKTPPHRLLCAPWPPVSRTLKPMYGRRPNGRPLHRHPRSRSWTDTMHAMTPRQIQDSPDDRLLRNTVHHASTRRQIVRHACKLPPPWPIKGGAVPQPQGTTDSAHSHTSCLHHDIGSCLNQYLWDLEARPALPLCL